MKVKNILATLPLVLNACGSEEASTDFTPNEPGQGIWQGGFSSTPITISSASGSVTESEQTQIQKSGVGLYSSIISNINNTVDRRAFFYNIDDEILFTNDVPGILGNNLYYSPDYYINGSNSGNSVNFDGNAYASSSLLGSYQGGIDGNYIMVFDDKYFRGADLSRLQGNWSYSDTNRVWDFVITSDGHFNISSTIFTGCVGEGDFSTIGDSSKNEYAIDGLVISDCGSFDGTYKGLAATVDTVDQNDTLLMAIYNASHGFFIKPEKNRTD